MDIHEQFNERITRAVSRFLHHCEGEGLDTRALDGDVTLHFKDGALAGIVAHNVRDGIPTRSTTVRDTSQPRKGKEPAK